MKPRQNEKKFHKELVDLVNDDLGGYGYKAQRGFIKGVPDIELKVPNLPLVKIEVKHEVYMKMPDNVPVALTQLQRQRLRHMRKAGLACGWAIFVTVAKEVYVVYGTNPDEDRIVMKMMERHEGHQIVTLDTRMEGHSWTRNNKLAVLAQLLNFMTQ